MGRLYLFGMGVLALAVVYHLIAPPELTLPARLGKLMGAFETAWIDGREEAVAAQIEALAEAEASVQRETLATQRALELEAAITTKQIESTSSSHWVKSFGANLTDAMCGLGMAGALLSPRTRTAETDQSAAELMKFCPVGDQIRRGMATDYSEALDDNRTSVMSDMMRAFDQSQGQ